jgi:hypothetical protein
MVWAATEQLAKFLSLFFAALFGTALVAITGKYSILSYGHRRSSLFCPDASREN